MDMSMLPAWAQTALAYAAVVIVALTVLANFLDWAVPRLRALAPSPNEARVLTAVERFALGLTSVLGVVHRLVPRLTVIEPVGGAAPPAKDDDPNDGGSAPPSAAPPLGPPPSGDRPTSPSGSASEASVAVPSFTLVEPHGPYAA
jgi:hypothetical protein